MPHCNKQMLSFFLTTKCNLCCRYCYNAIERHSIEEQSLSEEIAKAAIDWYFSSTEIRHIRFYGPGEPTCEFNLMKSITEYAKSHPCNGSKTTVEIQTNGIFPEETREWILENINIIWMSFDGMREIQNYYRPLNPDYAPKYFYKTTAEIIEDNTRWLISNKQKRNLMVGVRATITEENIYKQTEMIDYFDSLGVKHIWSDPLFHSVRETPVYQHDTSNEPLVDLSKYIREYLKAKEYAKNKGIFYGSFLAVNFDGESEYHCRSCTPLTSPHITTDGYISACDMVLLGSNAHHMAPLVVGRWNEEKKAFDLFYDKINYITRRKSTNMDHCKNCPVILHCGGYCLGETLNETGSLYGQIEHICDAIRLLYSKTGSCEKYDYFHP